MIEPLTAQQFADSWLSAWNAHDLDRIMEHYDPGIRFTSPYVARHADPSGSLEGLPALRAYFAGELERYPQARFEPLGLLRGVDGLTVVYQVEGYVAAETMQLAAGRIARCIVHWGSLNGLGRP